MPVLSKGVISVVLGSSAVVVAAATWYSWYVRKDRIPKEWLEVGEVKNLWIYPLKSGKAIEVQDAECTEIGLIVQSEGKCTIKDRFLIVYHEDNGEYRTARTYPQLIFIKVSAKDHQHVTFEAPNTQNLTIKLPEETTNPVTCTLFEREILKCTDCGDEAARWISQYCLKKDKRLRIGISAVRTRRIDAQPWVALRQVYKNIREVDTGLCADLCTFMITNEESLNDFNQRLGENISMLQFRPNIVIKGPEAYAEDNWDWIRIGEDVVFRIIKPCTRCIMTNIDPETGILNKNVLKKLKEYRQVTDSKQRQVEQYSPAFGVYAGIHIMGRVKCGDKFYIGK